VAFACCLGDIQNQGSSVSPRPQRQRLRIDLALSPQNASSSLLFASRSNPIFTPANRIVAEADGAEDRVEGPA
jgi:hypothetical protein